MSICAPTATSLLRETRRVRLRDAFQSIYDGWIDVTNVAITDDTAELLTGLRF